MDPGSWILDLGSWIQAPGSKILDPRSRILDSGSRILNPGCGILDPGSWIHVPGSRILDPRSWIQDPASGSWIQDPRTRILDPTSRNPGQGFQDCWSLEQSASCSLSDPGVPGFPVAGVVSQLLSPRSRDSRIAGHVSSLPAVISQIQGFQDCRSPE